MGSADGTTWAACEVRGHTWATPPRPTLQNGQTQSLNSISCASELSGMTCTDNRTGHYLRLSRDNYELH
jgi:hypothetical protein